MTLCPVFFLSCIVGKVFAHRVDSANGCGDVDGGGAIWLDTAAREEALTTHLMEEGRTSEECEHWYRGDMCTALEECGCLRAEDNGRHDKRKEM